MSAIGISVGGSTSARSLEDLLPRLACVEVVTDGFFARPSPYLSWLGRRSPVILRASTFSIDDSPGHPAGRVEALLRLVRSAGARHVVHTLGFSFTGDVELPAAVPLSLTPAALSASIARLAEVMTAHGCPTLIEPSASLLRVAGSLDEADFLTRLCSATGARLLVDVGTLAARHRNHGADPGAWLEALPSDVVGAVRLTALSRSGSYWTPDPRGGIDPELWTLFDDVVAALRPDLVILSHETADGDPEHELDRLTDPDVRLPSPMILHAPPIAHSPPPTDRAALFVLDDEGVVFSPARREMLLFNTAATFVWCLRDEGLTTAEISASYAEAFAVVHAEADRQVGSILRQWFALGLIDDPGVVDAEAMSLGSAVAHLLTNAGLRARFRASPHQLADRLAIESSARPAFAALVADELDAQAAQFTGRADPAPRRPLVPPALPDPPAGSRRFYRLATTTFAIDTESTGVLADIDAAMAHLACARSAADVGLEVVTYAGGAWAIIGGDDTLAEGAASDGIVPAVKQLVRHIAANRHRSLLAVHGGLVAYEGGCVLLPALAGSGKTTLTAGLVHAGATYFSDEIALLDHGALLATPMPLALTVKDGAVGPLRALYPELDSLPVHTREDGVRVRYLPPPVVSRPDPDRTAPVNWIVFPRYVAGGVTALTPIGRPAALRRLLDEAVLDREHLTGGHVESIVRWLRGSACYDLQVSSLEPAVALIRELVDAGRPGPAPNPGPP